MLFKYIVYIFIKKKKKIIVIISSQIIVVFTFVSTIAHKGIVIMIGIRAALYYVQEFMAFL